MSQNDALSRKDKKAQRDADRKKKSKKRKHEEIEDDTKVDENEYDKDFLPLDAATVEHEAKSKKKSKSQKEKSRKHKSGDIEEPTQPVEQNDAQSTEATHKKRKKDKDAPSGDQPAETETQVDKAHRFILFVGNLPYSTTDATLRAHFKKLEPFTVRHRTDPKIGKSKGFAFLEFENYDRMKTCLKLYHHSMFDPQKADAADVADADGEPGDDKQAKKIKPGKHARRINVELTAGGGGKAEGRKEKIRVKNERLGEQRQRRAEAERKEREKKAKEEGEADPKNDVKKKPKKVEEAKPAPEGMGGIHPSRLARIAA